MKTPLLILASLGLAASAKCASGNYQQCGGDGFTGSTSCTDGWKCQCMSQWYSQCLPPDQPLPSGWNQAGCKASSKPPSNAPKASINTATEGGNTGNVDNTGSSGSCSAYTGNKSGYATTTRHFDGYKGACGCGTTSNFPWTLGSGKIWTAAGSASLFDNGGSSTWCGSGCGTCYELTNVGAVASSGQGTCDGKDEKITVMVTNLCPASGGNIPWCSMPTNQYGYAAHFDIMAKGSLASGWDNPVVKYTKIACPKTLSTNYQQCDCAGKSRVRRGLVQERVEGHKE